MSTTIKKPNRAFLEKAFKVLALAERGVDGERDNAIRMLTEMLKPYGMTIADLKARTPRPTVEKKIQKEFILWNGELNKTLMRYIRDFMNSDPDLYNGLMQMLGSIMIYGRKARYNVIATLDEGFNKTFVFEDRTRFWGVFTGFINLYLELKPYNWTGKKASDMPKLPAPVAISVASIIKTQILEGRPFDDRKINGLHGKPTSWTIASYINEVVKLFEYHIPAYHERHQDHRLLRRINKITDEMRHLVRFALALYANEEGHLYNDWGERKK